MKNKLSILSIIMLVFSLTVPVSASMPARPGIDMPEESGLYDVPGSPDMKLRVFVHHAKPDADERGARKPAPSPAPTPALGCEVTTTADPDSSSTVSGAGWKMPRNWAYSLNAGSVPSTVGGSNLAIIASSSFAVWTSAMAGAVNITRGADTSVSRAVIDGQNIVAWGRTSGSALAVSYVWYYQTTGELVEVDTIMNKKFTWYWSDPAQWPAGETCAYQGVYDAQDILTHELGHTAGLDDEYEAAYSYNTMYGYGRTGETSKNTLTTGDKIGVYSLYWQ